MDFGAISCWQYLQTCGPGLPRLQVGRSTGKEQERYSNGNRATTQSLEDFQSKTSLVHFINVIIAFSFFLLYSHLWLGSLAHALCNRGGWFEVKGKQQENMNSQRLSFYGSLAAWNRQRKIETISRISKDIVGLRFLQIIAWMQAIFNVVKCP